MSIACLLSKNGSSASSSYSPYPPETLTISSSMSYVPPPLLPQPLTPLPTQISYPLAVINAIISFGLIYLSLSSRTSSSPIPRPTPGLLIPALFFGLTNVFLVVVPMTPPPEDAQPYERLPYWTHAVGGWAVFGVGLLWWAWRRVLGRGKDAER